VKEMRLVDRVAIVTGAARGIGRAIAGKLAEGGAKVVVADIDLALAESVAEKLKINGREVLAQKANVQYREEVEKMFEEVRSKFGKVDILINNAGIRIDSPLHKILDEEWESVVFTQLKGSFYCSREAQKDMIKQNYGKIVNLSSPVPTSLGYRRQSSYASASDAVKGFTKALAIELGGYNINVNCVAPDFIDTEMTRNVVRGEDMYLDDFKKIVEAYIPLRRMGTPDDVANVVLFLVSEESSFISGQIIYVKGGP
jgi:3-oxoacyl-[acyl-carrier protein] reductase